MNKEQRKEENKLLILQGKVYSSAFLSVAVGLVSLIREQNLPQNRPFIILGLFISVILTYMLIFIVLRYIHNINQLK